MKRFELFVNLFFIAAAVSLKLIPLPRFRNSRVLVAGKTDPMVTAESSFSLDEDIDIQNALKHQGISLVELVSQRDKFFEAQMSLSEPRHSRKRFKTSQERKSYLKSLTNQTLLEEPPRDASCELEVKKIIS